MTASISVALDHCVIAVSDWDRSTEFYRDVLGAQIVQQPHGFPAFRFGDQQLNVHGPGVDAGTLVGQPPVTPGNSDLCFRWSGRVGGAVEHLTSRGVQIEVGPVTRSGAGGIGASVYFRDP